MRVARPRLLLVPELTELEWAIKPQLEEWAEVASYDRPGIGEEPLPDGMSVEEGLSRQVVVERGLAELDRRGWESCVVAGDGMGSANAAMLAHARPGAVSGLALGHAARSNDFEGEGATMNLQIWEAMRQLIRQDYRSFIRFGITQMTHGSVGDELAERMLERMPTEFGREYWDSVRSRRVDIESLVRELEVPLLFAQHEGCLMRLEAAFDEMATAFPAARTVTMSHAPAVSDAFANALREFCEQIGAF